VGIAIALDQAKIAKAKAFAGNRVQSRVALSVKASAGRSRRDRIYEDGALRVRFPNGDDLEAVVINTAGGIAGGDRFAFEVDVGDGAALTVTTAAAEKTYRSLGEPATVDVKLNVGAGGSLYWLPQETILFNAAQLRRGIEADVAEDTKLLMIESVVFGRTAMDEAVTQGSLFDRWRLRRGGKLVFADTLRLDGAIAEKLGQPAIAAGGCAIATALLTPVDEAQVVALREQPYTGDVGVSAWNGFALMRLVARDGETLRQDIKLLLAAIGGTLPRLWLN
jgi:urease accessory protein